MKGVVIALLFVAACASPEPNNVEPTSPAVAYPNLDSVPALLRPLDADYVGSAVLLQGATAYELGDPDYAATRLQAARREVDAPPAATALHAWVLFDAVDAQAAQAVAVEGLTIYPASAAIRAVLVEALLRQQLVDEAAEAFGAIPAAASGRPYVLSLEARLAFAEERYPAVLNALDRVALSGPISDELVLLRARALEASGRPADALQLYEQLAGRANGDPRLLEEMSFAALRAARSTDSEALYGRAEVLLKRLVALDPQHASAHAGIARCAASRGQAELAYASWDRALELNPADVESAIAYAESLHANGQENRAIRLLQDLHRQPMSNAEHRRISAVQQSFESGGEPEGDA